MEEEIKIGCSRTSSNKKREVVETNEENISKEKGEKKQMISVGKEAPLFEAQAYKDGKFVDVKLEDYRGKWVLLCFYPGDFTFV